MGSFKKHYSRQAANEGAKMIVLDHNGKETEDFIMVRGMDSDAFTAARTAMQRKLQSFLEESGGNVRKVQESPEYKDYQQKLIHDLQRSLVISWSFEEECNDANIAELFKEAPSIALQVDAFAGRRSNFGSSKQPNSSGTPETSSN